MRISEEFGFQRYKYYVTLFFIYFPVNVKKQCLFSTTALTQGTCIFPCRCTKGCISDTGECIGDGQCIDGHPSMYKWHGPICQQGECKITKKYTAQYPVVRTVQSALHFTSLTNLFTRAPSRLLWEASSYMLQLMREGCSYTYPPLSIARYSFIQLSELEQCRITQLARGFNTQTVTQHTHTRRHTSTSKKHTHTHIHRLTFS